ncbi:MAG: hypothetical protein IJV81_08560 [Paludibacteraceae bacterium]|nr:hypothetical protein [Ruminococcus sp.]MBO5320959.1 hypothetical protein [Ruminococcus sp.]MBQ9752857.1 hypothetical protein [Paludibacteraceae bacterium]
MRKNSKRNGKGIPVAISNEHYARLESIIKVSGSDITVDDYLANIMKEHLERMEVQ